MIPTRRRNPWRPYFIVALVLWAIAFFVNVFTDALAPAIVSTLLIIATIVLAWLERRYEDESARIVAQQVYGDDVSAAWSGGFAAGELTERRRSER